MVTSTAHDGISIARNVLILGEVDAWQSPSNGLTNFWVAERGKTTGQGFTLRVDTCKRLIAGCQIKNMGNWPDGQATKDFRVLGSMNENGPWDLLVVDQLADTRDKVTSVLNFTFTKPVEIQFLKFELISYWGDWAGGLQYFAAIPAGEAPINTFISSHRSSCSCSCLLYIKIRKATFSDFEHLCQTT